MINDGINNVPDNTVAIFIDKDIKGISKERCNNLVKRSPKKRDWFTPHFYRCLPLTIGNQYGFTVALEFDFAFEWNGGDNNEDITFFFNENVNDEDNPVFPNISSHFGSGILTISTPFFFRTPPGVNLMTINPPNFIVPNITVMTGVIETDNLRRSFTFNLKAQMPNIRVFIPAGTPLAAFIPIPRYYADGFELKYADEIFDKDIVDQELQASIDAGIYRRDVESKLKNNVGRHYFLGKDVYNNEFPDHQKP